MNHIVVPEFKPPFGIGHGHVQTLLGSSFRKFITPGRVTTLKQRESEEIYTAADGTRLAVWISTRSASAPTIVLIHGWLGTHNSSYSLSLAEHLWQAGFNIVRLNLRDHGGTAHLNQGMFHNGLIDEVVDVMEQLAVRFGNVGLVGFSLGGNFALRVARQTGIPVLAVCPLMDPAASVAAIDEGWIVYKKYFMNKWLRALDEKTAAYPDIYDFETNGARKQTSVRGMTEHFVQHHTDYGSLAEYYDCYTLTNNFLAGTHGTILAAKDDPVVPAHSFEKLPPSINVTNLARGGHCAFIDSYRMTSYVDAFGTNHFKRVFGFSA